jgi:hypothetical protein
VSDGHDLDLVGPTLAVHERIRKAPQQDAPRAGREGPALGRFEDLVGLFPDSEGEAQPEAR